MPAQNRVTPFGEIVAYAERGKFLGNRGELSIPEAHVETAVTHLVRCKASKPRTQKILLSTLHALFKKELSEQQLSQLFTSLCSRGVVKVEGTKVSYQLPVGP